MAEDLKHLLIETNEEYRQLASSTTHSTIACTSSKPNTTCQTPSNSKKSVSRNANSNSKTGWNRSCGSTAQLSTATGLSA